MKTTTRRIVAAAAIVVILLILAGLITLYLSLNRIVRSAVETVGPQMTGTALTIGDVDVSPFRGKLKLQDLLVGNPEGFRTDSAFTLKSVEVHMDLRSLTRDTIIIHKIVVHVPQITYEMGMGGSNLAKIQQNIEDFAPKPATTDDEPEVAGKKVIIELFEITDGSVRLSASLLQGQAASLPLPDVRMADIGSNDDGTEGATWKEAVDEMFGLLLGSVQNVMEGAGALLKESGKRLDEAAREVGEGIKGSTEGAREAVDKTLGGIKNMFGGQAEEDNQE